MVTWPSTLPAPALSTFTEAPPNNTIRTQMDKGADKVRRRSTANVRPIGFSLSLTEAQVEILDTFYVTTTLSGSVEFDFIHPRTGATVEARFVSPPSYSEREAVMYSCSVQLEILP